MKYTGLPSLTLILIIISGLLTATAQAAFAETSAPGRLHFEGSVTRPDLVQVNSVEVSSDGRFIYATPWPLGAVVVFQREESKGGLAHIQTLSDSSLLAGNTGFALSPASNHAVAACFRAKTAVLMRREPKKGSLSVLDSVRAGDGDVTGLDFAIDAIFSPDGRFAYVLDGGDGGVAVFAVREDKLEWLAAAEQEDGCLGGSRGVAMDPKGNSLYVTGFTANTLTVLERNPQTGLVKVRQVIKDEEENVHGLAGAFGVVCSADGQFIYTTSGRFRGDSAVSVFRRNQTGKLEVVEEFIAERGELPSFVGGNRLILSPDEKNLYAVASRSGSVACFERDSKSGRLRHFETLTPEDDKGVVDGAAGITITPDGKYVYVAAEGKQTISIFRRE